jgi:hypothetical protein
VPEMHFVARWPDGDEIVSYIDDYVAFFAPPLREGVEVRRVAHAQDRRGFAVTTSSGDFTADNVVVAIGGYHTVTLPRMAERLPRDVLQLHSSAYKNPQSLPAGDVLVVGTGQSVRSPRICILAAAAFICRSGVRRAWRAVIVERMSWSGSISSATTTCPCTIIRSKRRFAAGRITT